MSLLNHRMRSTDKDLLAIQKKLGNIVYPQLDQSQLDRLADKSQAKLSTRIVTEKFGKELVQRAVAQAQHGPRQMAKMYTLTLKVGCRNIPTAKGAVKFNCTVQFVFAHVIGRGGDAETCLYGAKEAYRKHLGNELRDADSLLRRSFMRKVEVEPVNPQDAETRRDYSDLCDEAKERFRIWFSTGIRATDGKVKKLFFEKVQHEEERFTIKCSKCGQRKPDLDFFTKEGTSTECANCRPAEVPEVDELDELVEDQAADAQEDAENSEPDDEEDEEEEDDDEDAEDDE